MKDADEAYAQAERALEVAEIAAAFTTGAAHQRPPDTLKHFNEHTKKRVVGSHQLLAIDGHESHDSLAF